MNLTYNPDEGTWRNKAACLGTDPNMFYPVGTTGPAVEQIGNAKELCRSCVAQVACLEYALTTKQDDGIWGGATEAERRKILNHVINSMLRSE